MNDSFIRLSDVVPRIYGLDFPSSVNWDIKRGEQWCVIGRNGTGKTMLADILMGRYGIKSGSIDYAFWNEECRKPPRGLIISALSFERMCFAYCVLRFYSETVRTEIGA